MYRDKTLIPTEAVRLLALGLLAEGPRAYGDLAAQVRHFASHVTGPSLDLLGPSIELLRYEGFAAPMNADDSANGSVNDGGGADQLLCITDAGRTELETLLNANVRAPIDGLAKLVIALKFRFLDMLCEADRRALVDGLIDLYRAERTRLEELGAEAGDAVHLTAWIAHDIAQIDDRLAWLAGRRGALASA